MSTPTTEQPIIVFDKVNKWYGNSFHVLRDIDLQVAKGERIVICGPSGSGKSTMIRCINRLEEHQEGHLIVDGVELTDDVKAIDQNVVFQNIPSLLRRNIGRHFGDHDAPREFAVHRIGLIRAGQLFGRPCAP